MREQEIAQTIQEALRGSCKVTITFKGNNGLGGVAALLQLNRQKVLLINDVDQLRLWIAIQCGRWSNDLDRTVLVTFTENFKPYLFEDWMGETIEKIKVVF